MFKPAGQDIEVYCDSEAKRIRVAIISALLPGFRKTWREVDSFGNREEWVGSPLYHRVTSEEMQEAIEWFWFDISDGVAESNSPAIFVFLIR